MLDIFVAIKNRYLSTTLATSFNGFAAGDEFPDIRRPYLVGMPVAETRSSRTNQGSYFEPTFELHVIADSFEEATTLGYLVQDEILTPPLVLTGTGDRLLIVEEGAMSWREEDQYWRVIVEFQARVGKPGR